MGPRHAFGTFLGVETTKSGGLLEEQVPSQSRFKLSNPRYISSNARHAHQWGQDSPKGTKRTMKIISGVVRGHAHPGGHKA